MLVLIAATRGNLAIHGPTFDTGPTPIVELNGSIYRAMEYGKERGRVGGRVRVREQEGNMPIIK